MSSFLPLNETARESIIQVARALEARFPELTENWREQVVREFSFDPRTVAALKRLTIATGCSYFCDGDFSPFFENVVYFGIRLAKLEVDTRAVARSLEIYNAVCEPHVAELFGEGRTQAMAALEMLNSATFVALAGAYFDAKSAESDALLAVMEAEHSSPDVATLLQNTLQTVIQTFGATHGALMLRAEDSNVLSLEAAVGIDMEEYGVSIPVGQGFSGTVARKAEPQIVLDTSLDERIISPTLKRKAKTLWGVPLKGTNDNVGVLVIGFDKPYYEWLPRERHLMQAMADRAAGAIERARITEALREREMMIARLSGHLLTAQEEERKRISRELHDETGQALMVIRLYLGMLEQTVKARTQKKKIEETVEVVDRTIEGLRRIIAKLSPLVLQELGLVAAIRKEAKDLAKNTGVSARVSIPDSIGRFAPQLETAVYRIVQEALHNVAKHAEAKTVDVELSVVNGDLKLLIADDGIGMGMSLTQKSPAKGQSFGLAGIKERVGMLNGVVRVYSVKGHGTRIEISVPAAQPVDLPKSTTSVPEPESPVVMMGAAVSQGGRNA